VGFESIDDLVRMQGAQASDFVTFERTAGFRRLAASMDRDAVDHLLELAGIDEFIRSSLLPPDDGTTAEEYRDYLGWAFEEYAPDRPLDRIFGGSVVESEVYVPGRVIQVRGGETTASGARYRTPLIETVTAAEPIQHSIVFEPVE
jgi:hypothetical protein